MNRSRVERARESVGDHPRLAYAARARRMPDIGGPFEGELGARGW